MAYRLSRLSQKSLVTTLRQHIRNGDNNFIQRFWAMFIWTNFLYHFAQIMWACQTLHSPLRCCLSGSFWQTETSLHKLKSSQSLQQILKNKGRTLIIEKAKIDFSIDGWRQRNNLTLCVECGLETLSMVKGK